jgi:hypothetical protein
MTSGLRWAETLGTGGSPMRKSRFTEEQIAPALRQVTCRTVRSLPTDRMASPSEAAPPPMVAQCLGFRVHSPGIAMAQAASPVTPIAGDGGLSRRIP